MSAKASLGPVGTIIFGLFTLASMAVGAVGEVMGVRNQGAGGMLGYLSGG